MPFWTRRQPNAQQDGIASRWSKQADREAVLRASRIIAALAMGNDDEFLIAEVMRTYGSFVKAKARIAEFDRLIREEVAKQS